MKVGVQFFILLIVSLTARGAAGEDGGDPGGIRWLPDRIRDWHYFEFSHDDGWTQSYRLVPTGGGVPFRFWDRAFLSRAVTAQHYDQLRPLFERLSRGEPLTVLAIGSSVTALHAGCMHGPTPLVQATANLRHGNLSLPECRHDGWLSRVLRMINGTWPHQNHTLLNLAWPGSTMDRFTRRGSAPPAPARAAVLTRGAANHCRPEPSPPRSDVSPQALVPHGAARGPSSVRPGRRGPARCRCATPESALNTCAFSSEGSR